MKEQESKVRVFKFEVPATDGTNWSFEFKCRWAWSDPLQVVFTWEERTIGSGQIEWKDAGVSWGSLFRGWMCVRDIALGKAIEYEIHDRAV